MPNPNDFNQILSELENVARRLLYDVHRHEDAETTSIYCSLAPQSPMSLRVRLVKRDEQILISGTVRATGLSGDKTDIHDVLSTLWAVYLRLNFGVSVTLQSVVMEDILPDEIYSRNIFLLSHS